jgi:hypothetical protein
VHVGFVSVVCSRGSAHYRFKLYADVRARSVEYLMTEEMPLSTEASLFRARMADHDNFAETCDGGDAGSPSAPSIWLLGLEPGWSVQDQMNEEAGNGRPADRYDTYSVELQQKWPFNRNAFKLLASLKGEAPEPFKDFAFRERPFERGSKGYFKGNLFPVACNSLTVWGDDARHLTGFTDKSLYQRWMRATRFPIVKTWIEKCRPKLVICTGPSQMSDFLTVTGTPVVPEPHYFLVNGHMKRVHVASNGTVPVAVIPHLSGGTHSLNSAEAISSAAAYIKHRLPDVKFA